MRWRSNSTGRTLHLMCEQLNVLRFVLWHVGFLSLENFYLILCLEFRNCDGEKIHDFIRFGNVRLLQICIEFAEIVWNCPVLRSSRNISMISKKLLDCSSSVNCKWSVSQHWYFGFVSQYWISVHLQHLRSNHIKYSDAIIAKCNQKG